MSTLTNSTENTSSNPVVSITNNSGIDVEIFDVFDPNPEGQQGAYQYTLLAKVGNGQTANIQTLRYASELLAAYSGEMTLGGKSFYYQHFPLASKAISVLDNPPYAWAILADDYAGSQQAFQFVKFTSANPTSNIARGFITALQQNDEGATVNKYFAGSASFPKATFEAWTQIVFWQTQFLSAWQGPYFLYNVPKAGEKIQMMAAVSITSDSSGTTGSLYLPDDKGVVHPDAKKYGLKPSGTGAIVMADPDSSGMTLSLTPAWVTILTSTNAGADGYPVGGSLSGAFNNSTVVGTGQRLPPHWATPVPLRSFMAANVSNQSTVVPSPTSDSSKKSNSPWYSLWWVWVAIVVAASVISTIAITVAVVIRNRRRQAKISLVNVNKNPVQNREQIVQEQEKIEEYSQFKIVLDIKPWNDEYFDNVLMKDLENSGVSYSDLLETSLMDNGIYDIIIDGKFYRYKDIYEETYKYNQLENRASALNHEILELQRELQQIPSNQKIVEETNNLQNSLNDLKNDVKQGKSIDNILKDTFDINNRMKSLVKQELDSQQHSMIQQQAFQKIYNATEQYEEQQIQQQKALEEIKQNLDKGEHQDVNVNNFKSEDEGLNIHNTTEVSTNFKVE